MCVCKYVYVYIQLYIFVLFFFLSLSLCLSLSLSPIKQDGNCFRIARSTPVAWPVFGSECRIKTR